MQTSDLGLVQLMDLEGIICRIYYDSVGVRTLGVGATVSEIPDISKISLTKYFDTDYLMSVFLHGIQKYERAVNRAVKKPLSQPKFDALVSICYNIGTAGLTNSTFMRLINQGASVSSVGTAIMAWTKQKELVGRRTKEKILFVNEKYSTNGTAILTDTNGAGVPLYKKGKRVDALKILNAVRSKIAPNDLDKYPEDTIVIEAPRKVSNNDHPHDSNNGVIVQPTPQILAPVRDLTMDDIWIIAKNVYGALTE